MVKKKRPYLQGQRRRAPARTPRVRRPLKGQPARGHQSRQASRPPSHTTAGRRPERWARKRVSWTGSDTVDLGLPFEPKLPRRRHVAHERRGGDDSRTREVAFAAESHAVLPVAVEGGDGALPLRQRIGTLSKTGAAPRLTNLGAGRPEHVRNR